MGPWVQRHLHARAVVIAWGTIPPAQLVAGLLAEGIGAGPSFLAFAAIMLATAVAATAAPSVRHAPPIEALTPEAA